MISRLSRFARVVVPSWIVWLRGQIDASDVLATIGLASLFRGLWLVRPAAAYIACGLVLLWLALPPRPPFVMRPPKDGKA